MAGRRGRLLPSPVVAGWYDELLAGTMVRVSFTGEEMDHDRLLLWPSRRISEQGGARSHWWVPSLDGDVWEEYIGGTDPSAGILETRGCRGRVMADGDMGSGLFPQTESC